MYLFPKKTDTDGQFTNPFKERRERGKEGRRGERGEDKTGQKRERWTYLQMKHVLNSIHSEINLLSDNRVLAFDTYLSLSESLLLC